MREIVDAICHVLRGGIAWRLLPDGFPPWRTVVVDSQSVKTTESGGVRGCDAGKKIKGRKRHMRKPEGQISFTVHARRGTRTPTPEGYGF